MVVVIVEVLVLTEVKPEVRAGNYVFYNLPLQLTQWAHVTMFFPDYHWLQHTDIYKPFGVTGKDTLGDALASCDFVLWMGSPPGAAWWSGVYQAYPQIRAGGKKVIYYALDYWEAWIEEGNRKPQKWMDVEAGEKEVVSMAEKVFAVSPQLCSYLVQKYGLEKVYWLPNASRDFPPASGSRKEQIVVISSSFYSLREPERVISLAKAYPDWIFVWAGTESTPRRPSLRGFTYPPNFIFPGEVGNLEFMDLAARASLGLVPAGGNWFSYFADPTKWYYYHMLRLPIVSVNTPHHWQFPGFYPYTWAGVDLFEVFRNALNGLDKVEVNPCNFHTWEHRASAFLAALLEDRAIYGYADSKGFHFTFRGE